mmetsp:Transcript_132170/g.233783  ORF Transcript_132170/g.233783 Transcript_132170/m.233783 type:complete len:286 (+) Transcript_132170:75-932(+)
MLWTFVRCNRRPLTAAFSSKVLHETFSVAPGLVLLPSFLAEAAQDEVFRAARNLALAVDAAALTSKRPPVTSPAHNLSTREEYIRVSIPSDKCDTFPAASRKNLSCEHFTSYGDGHRLTYFRGNENIPTLRLVDSWLDQLGSLPWVAQELLAQREQRGRQLDSPAKWRMTLNHYHAIAESTTSPSSGRVGFPWHRDLEANGAATMILALGAPAVLEFGQKREAVPTDGLLADSEREDVESLAKVVIHPGSLLVLSGAARWDLLHRVAPEKGSAVCERISLVYGCW